MRPERSGRIESDTEHNSWFRFTDAPALPEQHRGRLGALPHLPADLDFGDRFLEVHGPRIQRQADYPGRDDPDRPEYPAPVMAQMNTSMAFTIT